jgi:AcrR family transcriptional regulator
MSTPSRRRRRVPQAKQPRSKATRERLVRATEDLLTKQDFASLTVTQIAANAHASVGTFYKHFPSKRDLLPLLVDRQQSASDIEDLESTIPQSAGEPLASRVASLVHFVAAMTTRRKHILRACVAARYTAELTPSSIQTERARQQMMRVHEWLLERRDEISHPNPAIAVRAGVYLCLQSLQTALLIEQLPTDIPVSRLVSEAEHMLLGYLTGGKFTDAHRLRRRGNIL